MSKIHQESSIEMQKIPNIYIYIYIYIYIDKNILEFAAFTSTKSQ